MRLRRLLLAVLLLCAAGARAQEPERAQLGLGHAASAEDGGFYQAIALGYFRKHGVQVTLLQGSPNDSALAMLRAGQVDLALAPSAISALDFAAERGQYRVVAAFFQRDTAALLAHADVGHESLTQLKGQPVLISAEVHDGWWQFLRARFGYSDGQILPYDFSLKAFLADPLAAQQARLGVEPYLAQQAGGVAPQVLLLADEGYAGYGGLLAASDQMVRHRPYLLRHVVEASIEGWYSYLYGDPEPAHALIVRENPAASRPALEAGRAALLANAIVDSGDAELLGIGAMNDARWKKLAAQVLWLRRWPADTDIADGYTLAFVNRRIGMGMKRRR